MNERPRSNTTTLAPSYRRNCAAMSASRTDLPLPVFPTTAVWALSDPGAFIAHENLMPRRVVAISSAGPPKRQSASWPWEMPVSGETRVIAPISTRVRRTFIAGPRPRSRPARIVSWVTLPGMSPSGASTLLSHAGRATSPRELQVGRHPRRPLVRQRARVGPDVHVAARERERAIGQFSLQHVHLGDRAVGLGVGASRVGVLGHDLRDDRPEAPLLRGPALADLAHLLAPIVGIEPVERRHPPRLERQLVQPLAGQRVRRPEAVDLDRRQVEAVDLHRRPRHPLDADSCGAIPPPGADT